jgi:hypothetical protein
VAAQQPKPAAARAASAEVEAHWSRQDIPALVDARAELAHLRERLGEQHPEVVALQKEIVNLEKKSPWTFSIDFPGGTLKQVLTPLAGPDGVSFSLIGSGEPADFATELPPFSLHNANLITVAKVLGTLLEARGFQLRVIDDSGPSSVVCVLTRRDTPKPEKRPPQTLFESFPLGAFLGEQSIDDIVGAIRTGWELDPAHDRDALRLKFHPPTSILLVSGPPEAIMVATKVISQLKGTFDKDSKHNLKSQEQNPPSDKK